MLINIHCAKCVGIEAVPVVVEVDITSGLGIHLVGLADAAVKESLLRTITALQSMGFRIPGKKIVINRAPADMHKKGSGYDVPIALGIIKASGQRELPLLEDFIIMGELGLDGTVRDVPGAIPIAELASSSGLRGCILPYVSAKEAMEYEGVEIYGVDTLDDVLRVLSGDEPCKAMLVRNRVVNERTEKDRRDMSGHSGEGNKDSRQSCSVDFSEISLFNGKLLEIYQPTFLMIFVVPIPIAEIEEKVGYIVLSLVNLKSL